MFAWLWWGFLLLLPVAVALTWAMGRVQKSIDGVRRHDPHMASGIEQVAYGGSEAALPMRDRSLEKPRHPNHF